MNRETWPTLQRAVDALRGRAQHGPVISFGRRKAARVLAEYERRGAELERLLTPTPPGPCGCCGIDWQLCRGLYDKGLPRCCSDCTHDLHAQPARGRVRYLASVCAGCGHTYNFHASTGRCEVAPSALENRCWCRGFVDNDEEAGRRP